MSADGKLSWVLRPMENKQGEYWMGNSRIRADLDLSSLVLFAKKQPDGSLLLSVEPYSEKPKTKREPDAP